MAVQLRPFGEVAGAAGGERGQIYLGSIQLGAQISGKSFGVAPFLKLGMAHSNTTRPMAHGGAELQWRFSRVPRLSLQVPLFGGAERIGLTGSEPVFGYGGTGIGLAWNLLPTRAGDLSLRLFGEGLYFPDRSSVLTYSGLAVRFVFDRRQRRPTVPAPVPPPPKKPEVKKEPAPPPPIAAVVAPPPVEPPKPDYAAQVKDHLESLLSTGRNDSLYFSDAALVDFEEKIIRPYAREGRLEALRDGLDRFYGELGRGRPDPESEKNYYALYVLKEFLVLSLRLGEGGRYSKETMDQAMSDTFYSTLDGERFIMDKTKLGVNLYLRVLMETDQKIAVPDEALLDYFYRKSMKRSWVEEVRKKYGGEPKP